MVVWGEKSLTPGVPSEIRKSLDRVHRRRVRVGVRVREQTRYIREQYGPQLLNFPWDSRS